MGNRIVEMRGGKEGPSRLVDIATVAQYLGVNVRHVRRLVAERQIPFIKWRRLLRFDLKVVEAWVDRHRHGEEGQGRDGWAG